MSFQIKKISAIILAAFSSTYSIQSFGQEIEKITVVGSKTTLETVSIATEQVTNPDISSWLNSIPGASVNRNGPLTGIAQYRGLFGDRVAATINGQTIIGAGPNAMDTPLSYAPRIITESLSGYRGISPVSSSIESLGGTIEVVTSKAQFEGSSNDLSQSAFSGNLATSYTNANDGKRFAGSMNVALNDYAGLFYIDDLAANDNEAANGNDIHPTEYDKTQFGTNLRGKFGQHILSFSYDYSDTTNSGTPALPMDIKSIYASRYNISGQTDVFDGELSWNLGYIDNKHGMDNFSLRTNMMPNMYRRNDADANTTDFSVVWEDDVWKFGVDGYTADHNSTITNPNNAMFAIENFNDVEDTRIGAFGEWRNTFDATVLHLGVRVKHISADAGQVSHHMAMMNPVVGGLVSNFNESDRSVDDTNIDATVHITNSISDSTDVNLSFAVKQRAPSYQERYLWVPMEATGGLADGNTYLGDINLDSETAYQSNIGLTYLAANLSVMFDAYYQKIDDYIQGVPSMNMPARMFANMMMGDDNLLQYANVEASLTGFESRINYNVTDNWKVSSMVSYVRGEREDINDDLYRIAPLKGQLAVSYSSDNWTGEFRFNAVDKQDKVSTTNQEQETSGYAFVDVSAQYFFGDSIVLEAGIYNLFDREYEDHLSGYNRVQNTDIAVMERLPSVTRNVWMELNYSF